MKSALLLLLALLSLNTRAAVLTVSNTVAAPGQYNTIPDAIAAAQVNDTIYVHGSLFSYGNISVTKPLHFMGTGHHPRKQFPFVSTIGTVTFTTAATGTVIDGFVMTGGIEANLILSDITIRNSSIGSIQMGYDWGTFAPMTNWIYEDNVIMSVINMNGNEEMSNVLFRNNIIHGQITNVNSGLMLDHNMFYASTAAVFSNVNNAQITNNIFHTTAPSGASNSTFLNNLTFNTSQNTLPYGSNTGSGNLTGDPQFVNFPAATFDISHNYHLQSGSPAQGAASDGSNIGVESGAAGFSMTGEPPAPVIRAFNIMNMTVPAGGQLNISVTATKAEDQ